MKKLNQIALFAGCELKYMLPRELLGKFCKNMWFTSQVLLSLVYILLLMPFMCFPLKG